MFGNGPQPLCGQYVAIGDYPHGEYNLGRCNQPAIEETVIPDHFYGRFVWLCAEHGGVADKADDTRGCGSD